MRGLAEDLIEAWGIEYHGPSKRGKVAKLKKPEPSRKVSYKPSRGRPIGSGWRKPAANTPKSEKLNRSDLERVLNNSPEVVVKLSKPSKDKASIKNYIDYISRKGELVIETDDGRILDDRESNRELVDEWNVTQIDEMAPRFGERKETLNLILSMPPGTNSDGLRAAASDFAKKNFPDHPYVFAPHNDEKHPHVHLVVRAENNNGRRLHPTKVDLFNWRRSFASELRSQGIDANATPRRPRGIVIKAEPSAERIINEEYMADRRESMARNTQSRMDDAKKIIEDPANERSEHVSARASISRVRKELLITYQKLHTGLKESSNPADHKLADKLISFVQKMPSPKTKCENYITHYKEHQHRHRQRQQEKLASAPREKVTTDDRKLRQPESAAETNPQKIKPDKRPVKGPRF